MKVKTQINKLAKKRERELMKPTGFLEIDVYWVPPMGQALLSHWGYGRKHNTQKPQVQSLTWAFPRLLFLPLPRMLSPNNPLVSFSFLIFLQRSYYPPAHRFSIFLFSLILCLSVALSFFPSLFFSFLSFFNPFLLSCLSAYLPSSLKCTLQQA